MMEREEGRAMIIRWRRSEEWINAAQWNDLEAITMRGDQKGGINKHKDTHS